MKIRQILTVIKAIVRFAEATWYYVRAITRKILDEDVLFLASGLAFNGILTMIPIMLLSASAIGIFLNSSQQGVRQLNDVLNAIFPTQPFATSIKESILKVVSDIVAYRRPIGLFGAAALLWTATSLFDAVRSVLHRIYCLKRTRGLLISIVHDIGFVFLVFILFVGSNLAIWAVTGLQHLILQVPPPAASELERFTHAVPTSIVVILTGIMFYIVYRFIPDTRPPRAAGIISTVTTTVLWVISGKAFALYLSSFSSIGKIYGPYAFVLVLMFWIYYSSLVFVLGAIVGQVYWERKKLHDAGRLGSRPAEQST